MERGFHNSCFGWKKGIRKWKLCFKEITKKLCWNRGKQSWRERGWIWLFWRVISVSMGLYFPWSLTFIFLERLKIQNYKWHRALDIESHFKVESKTKYVERSYWNYFKIFSRHHEPVFKFYSIWNRIYTWTPILHVFKNLDMSRRMLRVCMHGAFMYEIINVSSA